MALCGRRLHHVTLPRPLWSYDDWWAPSVLAAHGRYYLYYGGKDLQTGRHCLAIATAPRPTGPFTHRVVLSCGDTTSAGYVDPAPFLDSDGQVYLYYSVDTPVHTISALRLRPDLLHATGPRVELLGCAGWVALPLAHRHPYHPKRQRDHSAQGLGVPGFVPGSLPSV